MMRFAAFIFAMTAACPVHAQLTAPPTALTGSIDPARLAAAKRLVEMTNLEAIFDGLFIPLAPTFAHSVLGIMATEADTKEVIETIVARDAGNRDRMVAILSEEFLVSIRRQYPALLDSAAKEYAAAFTTQELREIADFYASGPGAKALKLMPQLQASMAKSGEALGMSAGREAGERAFERIADELLPEDTEVTS